MSSLRKERADRLGKELQMNALKVPRACPDCRHYHIIREWRFDIGACRRYEASTEVARAPSGRCGALARGFDPAEGLPGVEAASLGAILQKEAERPLRGGAADLAHDSMFGDGHKQKELF